MKYNVMIITNEGLIHLVDNDKKARLFEGDLNVVDGLTTITGLDHKILFLSPSEKVIVSPAI